MSFENYLKEISKISIKREKENTRFFQRLKQRKPGDLDAVVMGLHKKAFEKINCLECANCCKTTSPIFLQRDIDRLAKFFKITPGEFIRIYLHMDEDGDFVLNGAPCPFLQTDNTCRAYEARPNACREYPHTYRRKFHQVLPVTLKNTAICPAVFEIVEELKRVYGD